MKKGLALCTAIFLLTSAYGENTQLNKQQILSILQSSAKATGGIPSSAKRSTSNITSHTAIAAKKNQEQGIEIVKSMDEAIQRSGIILPNPKAGIRAGDRYANLPFGTLPNIPVYEHKTATGVTLRERYQILSGKKPRSQAIRPSKVKKFREIKRPADLIQAVY